MKKNPQLPIDYSNEVREAIEQNKPVVALESTIITHGMKYPENVKTAQEVEDVIRENGAVPATIAIIQGRIKIGLEKEQIEYLGQQGFKVKKCSRRDISIALAKKLDGSTTVSATMIFAEYAGIRVFVTGGIGGVHRGAEKTFDISADLQELGKTPVVVICAGAKSILDIPKTLEYLETQGVPILGYKTKDFPCFFVTKSDYLVSHQVEHEKECAEIINMQFDRLNLKTGILVTIPVPKEHEADGSQINIAISQALKEADEQNISGAEMTPFLLKRINELTGGESLKANIALIKNNAQLGANISKEYTLIKHKKSD